MGWIGVIKRGMFVSFGESVLVGGGRKEVWAARHATVG